jgi:hypothetical protein
MTDQYLSLRGTPLALLAGIAALSCAAAAAAADKSYTFVDFGGTQIFSDYNGTQSSAATQTVEVQSDKGDGLMVSGSLAVGRWFYVGGGYESDVVDVNTVVSSPLAVATTSGNFDLTRTRAAFGFVHSFSEKFDLFAEATYDGINLDFGSFAGENFDVDESGAGFGVGVRFNATPKVELYAAAHGSSVGRVDLNSLQADSGTEAQAGLRFYFFQDLGVGFDYRGRQDHLNTFTVSMRFGFGELRAGRE